MSNVGEIISAYSGLTLQQSILLIVFVSGFLAVICYIIAAYGIQTKWFTIGGGKKDLNQSKHDMNVKERLKSQTDTIDKEATNELYDLARHLSRNFSSFLGKHCYFTLYTLSDAYKDILKERIRHNNLKVKLVPQNRQEYIDYIVSIMRSEYDDICTKIASVACHEQYPPYSEIAPHIQASVEQFYEKAYRIEVTAIRKKIRLYEDTRDSFQSSFYRRTACEEPLARNQGYLAALQEK